MANIGMMEGAFFVGRKEIMDWINQTLDLNLSKVEDTANGAIACQILDIMYPNQIPMHKVNWAAKQDFEYVANYKILQTCFTKFGIDRHIDVDRLISGRYMDNLEFMQWFKRFFEMSVSDKGDYDAYAQRSKGKGGAQYNNGGKRLPVGKSASGPSTKPSTTAAKSTAMPAPKVKTVTAAPAAVVAPEVKPTIQEREVTRASTAPTASASVTSISTAEKTAAAGETDAALQKEINTLRGSVEESRKSYTDLKQEYEGLEKERDFYFEKLRDIEIMLQDLEDKGQGNELTAAIFKILYATADGFEPQAEESGDGVDGDGVATEAETVEETF